MMQPAPALVRQRLIEALRLYAAVHEDRLPAKLDDVGIPLSVDPVTGKAFPYQLKGPTVTVHDTPLGMERSAAYNVRYEVTKEK